MSKFRFFAMLDIKYYLAVHLNCYYNIDEQNFDLQSVSGSHKICILTRTNMKCLPSFRAGMYVVDGQMYLEGPRHENLLTRGMNCEVFIEVSKLLRFSIRIISRCWHGTTP